ncbi:MAG: hypothetical protein E7206_08870 [Clostridium beijerinckii]|nr:hypothetical protein [Clostridium beijerinckii]
MNIIEILWKIGYDVLKSDSEKCEYTIMYAPERKRRMWKQIKDGTITVENDLLNDIYTVTVGEVCFNQCGDLYVEFTDVNTKKCIDFYEHKNMKEDELYK